MSTPSYSRFSLIVALIVLIPLAGCLLADKEPSPSTEISLKTYGQPTIGDAKAPVHVVVFEEPKCPQCKNFTTRLFPKIKKEFIDTGKIRYTVIPVSFIPHSMPAAVAWLCVFNQEKNSPNHALFFAYLDYMYAHQPAEYLDWAKEETLEKFAKEASPAIQLDLLKNCLAKETYRIQIEKNTKYGMEIMKGELSTPTVYVDGIKVEETDEGQIRQFINSALRRKEG